jgi:translocation and assembly module TamB
MSSRDPPRSDRPPPPPPEPSEPHFVVSERPTGRGRRALRVAGAALGTAVTFVAAAAGGVLLHVGTPPARRLVAGAVNQVLEGTFRGKIQIVRVAGLKVNGVDGAVVKLLGPQGEPLVLASGVRARVALLPLLSSILAGRDLHVDVTELSIDHVDALLVQNADGAFAIAEAFQPAQLGPPPPPEKTTGGLDLALMKVHLGHAWVHGATAPLPVLDADLDGLDAGFEMSPRATSIDLRRLVVRTRGMPKQADVGASIAGRLALPAEGRAEKMSGALTLDAAVGGVELAVRGAIDGKKVDATVDVPRVVPCELDRMLGSSPIHDVASLHAEAHGSLPDVDPWVHVELGEGKVDARARVTLPTDSDPALLAKLTVQARDVDGRAAGGPASKMALDLDAKARVNGGAVDGTYALHVPAGVVSENPTPDLRVAGAFTQHGVTGAAHVAEPGAPTDLRFNVDTAAKDGPAIAFDANARAEDLAAVRGLGSIAGRALVRAGGRVALGSKQVTAHVDVTADRVAAGAVKTAHLTLGAVVRGTLGAPTASVNVAGSGLEAGGFVFPEYGVSVEGSPRDLRVDAELAADAHHPAIGAGARLHLEDGVAAEGVVVTLAKEKDRVTARVASARVRGGRVDVDGVRVEGAGAPLDAEAHLRPGSLVVKAKSDGLDLPTLLRLAPVAVPLHRGAVVLDVDVEATRKETVGHADASVHRLDYGDVVRGLEAKIGAAFDGTHARLEVDARDADQNVVTVRADDATLGGGALDPRAFTRAAGSVHALAHVDLARVNSLARPGSPFHRLKGELTAKLDVDRPDPAKRPALAFDVATRGLHLTTRPPTTPAGDGQLVVVGEAVHSAGVDARVRGHVDTEGGGARVDAILVDHLGELLGARVETTLPMRTLLEGGPVDDYLTTPVKLHAEMPMRKSQDLPKVLARVPMKGDVGFVADVEGTARAPHVHVAAEARNVTDPDAAAPIPVTYDATLDYDGVDAKARLLATRHAEQHGAPDLKALDAAATLHLAVEDLLAGSFAWGGEAEVAFDKFPIGSVTGMLVDDDIAGDVTGKVALHDLHRAASLGVDLRVDGIVVDGSKLGAARVDVAAKDGTLDAGVRLDEPDGYAHVRATTGLAWGAEVAPAMDPKRPVDVGLEAKNFRVGVLGPFVRSVAGELDGRLNADAKLHVKPGMKGGGMDGAISIDRGVFETPSIGQEFKNLRARIFMKPWGVWNVQEVSADGTGGHFTANAVAHLDGIRLRSAEAHLDIAQGDKLPITVQGVDMGRAWGHVDTTAKMSADGKQIAVEVKVPTLHVELPQSIGHALQSTTPDPSIAVGMILDDGKVALLPYDGSQPPPEPPKAAAATPEPPTHLRITTHLGPDIEVRRGAMLRAYVHGGPTVDVGKETKLSGSLSIPRGYVELQGKRFQIEKADVKFDGQPKDDPVVIATAVYTATDGTKVYADFVGPVKTGKVTLRSDPALSQNEILSLLLFGSAEGTFGQGAPPGQQGNDTTETASLAGGVVTDGLNKALTGVSDVEVQTKVDTQESGDPRPEVEVALSRHVSATIIYNLGVPPPGQNPDDTLVEVDWRFHRNYSTQATLGDRGTSILDLTWKYRY